MWNRPVRFGSSLGRTNMIGEFGFFIRLLLSRVLSASAFSPHPCIPRFLRHFLFRPVRNTLISTFSYVSIRTFVRLPMLGPGNARWLCLSSSFSRCQFSRLSRARVPQLPSASPAFPFLPPLTSTTPLPLHCLCLPRSPRLSRSRVLLTRTRFSSPLSSIRAGLPAPTHPPPHDGKGCQGERGRVEEVTRGGSGRDGRTGPTHRSRDIHFHFIFLARYRRQRKIERKKRKKRKKWRDRARFEKEEVVRKNFGHFPASALIGQGFSIRFATSLTRGKKGMRRKGYVASYSCGCVLIKG